MRPITLGIAIALALAVVGLFFVGPRLFTNPTEELPSSAATSMDNAPTTMAPVADTNQEGVVTKDEVAGTGTGARAGDTLTVHYVGALSDGRVFDSSQDRGPFSFVLGAGQVIRGWDEGLVGMKVGGKRVLTISPAFAYGSADLGVIPPNSTLVFEVELLKIGQ